MIVELETLNRRLIDWLEDPAAKALNLVSVPYRGIEPLAALLSQTLKTGRILYITGPAAPEDAVTTWLNRAGVSWSGEEDPASQVVVRDFDGALLAKGHYDLIIYDDLNSFPIHRKASMQEMLSYHYGRSRRILAYSMEPVFQGVPTLELPLKEDHSFVTEPRFLDLKTDIRTSIPSSLYEYIDFFHNDRRPVIVVVPDQATAEGMAAYLCRVNPVLADHIHPIDDLTDDQVAQLIGNGSTILFSTGMRELRMIPRNLEFIVIHSEEARHEYRQFVFLCLRAGLCDEINGEVILVSPEMTYDMDRTKVLTQNFNRVIWESDQLAR